jgi:hypothetical protein
LRVAVGVSVAAALAAPLFYASAHSQGCVAWLARAAMTAVALAAVLWTLLVLWMSAEQ